MIKLLSIYFISLSAFAGVGGIDGGSVHFQKNSTWVNMVYSKSLCYKNKTYFAPSKKCLKWENSGSDDRTCVKEVMITMTQPEKSTYLRCAKYEDDRCVKWDIIDYHQKPSRLVKFKDEDNRVIRIEKLRVKSCK
jgi:hypothetical protein